MSLINRDLAWPPVLLGRDGSAGVQDTMNCGGSFESQAGKPSIDSLATPGIGVTAAGPAR
jgi:hypothetical protein